MKSLIFYLLILLGLLSYHKSITGVLLFADSFTIILISFAVYYAFSLTYYLGAMQMLRVVVKAKLKKDPTIEECWDYLKGL